MTDSKFGINFAPRGIETQEDRGPKEMSNWFDE